MRGIPFEELCLCLAPMARNRRAALPAPVRWLHWRPIIEELREFFRHRAPSLLGIDDRQGMTVIASHIVADADCNQLHRRIIFDFFDGMPQMSIEIISRIDR